MKPIIFRHGVSALCTAALLALIGVGIPGRAFGNPVPPGYVDFPIGPGTFVSRVGGPLLADDFLPAIGGRIAFVEWWGSPADGPWSLSLYANTDADPSTPDAVVMAVSVVAAFVEPWEGGLSHYGAVLDEPGWVVVRGQPYWFGVASVEEGWQWALGDGVPDLGGAQVQSAVGSPDGLDWAPLSPSTQFAFGVWPTLTAAPGTLSLMLVGLLLAALVLSRRMPVDRAARAPQPPRASSVQPP